MSIVLALSVQTLVDPALQTTTANDPGLDGTHPDLKLGTNLKQNVLDTSNFSAQDAMLPITYLRGIPNTDQSGGHGTHVAGIAGATGAASSGKYAGIAPGANLVGTTPGRACLFWTSSGRLTTS